MQEQLLESAEFYKRRYQNFSTVIIVPVLIFVIAAILFMRFAPKETAIKSRGEIRPTEIISRVHSTNSAPIVNNQLKQNQFIEKGEELLTYYQGSREIEVTHLQNQLEEANKQLEEAEKLVVAIEADEDVQFADNDYGYAQSLADYKAQIKQLEHSTKIESVERERQNIQISDVQNSIDQEIDVLEKKKVSYGELRKAIESGDNLSEEHPLYSTYEVYQDQLKAVNRESTTLNQIILEIDDQSAQLDNSLSSFKTQRTNVGSVVTTSSSDIGAQKSALSAQYLLQTQQDLTQLNATITEIESTLSIQEEQANLQKVIAPESGVLQINEEILGSAFIPEGTLIGEIYPELTSNNRVQVETYLFSQAISDINIEDTVRFRIPMNGLSKGMEFEGKVTEIDHSASRTEQGNVYKVIGEVEINDENQSLIRYGLEGEVLLVTGETTYLEYYIDKFLNN